MVKHDKLGNSPSNGKTIVFLSDTFFTYQHLQYTTRNLAVADYMRLYEFVPIYSMDFRSEKNAIIAVFNKSLQDSTAGSCIEISSANQKIKNALIQLSRYYEEKDEDSTEIVLALMKSLLPSYHTILIPQTIGLYSTIFYAQQNPPTPEPPVRNMEHQAMIKFIALDLVDGEVKYDAIYVVDLPNLRWLLLDKSRILECYDKLGIVSANYLKNRFCLKKKWYSIF